MSLKKFLLLTGFLISTSISVMAQTKNDYATAWKKVTAFDEKGLPKSALAEVMKIYQQALKEENMGQQIKAAMYQIKYRNQVEEDSRENNIFFVDTLIAKAKAPAKNILQNMQAEMFWSYAQQNRWKLYSRTQLAEEKSNDITTWSLQKLNSTISRLYKASLQPESLLKQTKLESFDDIINKGKNSRNLRPTLYDFLSHRALAYFTNDEKDVTKPAYQFTINHPQSFAPAAIFIRTDFKQADTAATQYQALKIFQGLLAFHLNDAQPDALIDADLARLQFVNSYGIFNDKDKKYEAALREIETRYPANPLTAEAMNRRANIYYTRGEAYTPFGNTTNQYEIKRAKELLDSAYARFPKSEGGINAKNFMTTLQVPSLNIQTEKVNVPGQPFRSLVKYKNINKLYCRIVKTSWEDIKKINRTAYDKLWAAYTALRPIKSWSQDLPDLKDLQEHSAEIKIDALPNGTYFLLTGINADFSLANNIISKQIIQVSNISYISNNRDEYYVLHRDNGTPLPNTQVQLWESKYNYKTSAYEDTKLEKYTADRNGYFKIKTVENRNYKLQFNYEQDELFPEDYGYRTYYNSYEAPVKPQSFLFSDRGIYRPGQTIFFKGIVVKKENTAAKAVILPGYKTKIILRDANSQKVSELELTTNEFGSYKGNFKLPAGLLSGAFSLLDETTGSIHSFRVEEYKRPKFIVEIEKPKGTYRVNDSITVTGNAKAYAGNNIDGAKVSYRVVRQVRYPIWWEWGYLRKGRSIYPPRNTDAVEITNGIATTDGDGQFKITFKALPDKEVDKASQPTFYYEVSADITDINGETRSAETSVAVAYQMLQLNINSNGPVPADSLKNLLISSTNLNDIFEKAKVEVSIYKVQQPNKIFRTRFWERPDQFVMSKEEYYGYFPYDVYDNEDQFAAWPVAEKLFSKTDSTAENQQFAIGSNKLKAGWYKIVVTTKDKYGELVNAEKYIQLTEETGTIKEPVRLEAKKLMAEPGEKIGYNIRTGFDKIWLIHTLNKMPKQDSTTYLSLAATAPFRNEIAVTENDRGGIAVSYAFVQHNRVYNSSQFFNIPWNNKELQIRYETFRDKLLPGAQEKWKVKVTGNKGEKVNAEILTAMYDASLDQYAPYSWNALNIWPGLYNTVSWTHNTFTYINSEEYTNLKENYLSAEARTYDQLLAVYQEGNYYGYYYRDGDAKTIRLRGENGIAAPAPATSYQFSANVESRIAGVGVKDEMQKKKTGILEEKELSQSDSVKYPANQTNENVQVRKNFNETAFFFPELLTDAEGNVEYSFTIPEALTSWKLMTFAHTKGLSSGYDQRTTVTQKPLMVQPNAPRFMREGDRMEFSAKIVNLSDKEVTGTVQLELLDAATNKPVDGWFKNVFPSQYFTVAAGKSEAVKFPMEIPFDFNSAMSYRIVAKTAEYSDGEEMAIPILTNRMLVTETLPLNMRNTSSKTFRFDKLLNSGNSTTISQHALTVEYTSNPAWYAVQALPYLMEYPYECAEQTFNRYYANALASSISNSIPKIKAVFEKWSTLDTAALQSNLEKNQELKSALLEETPWVLAAQNENQQKKHIAELFNLVKLGEEMNKAFDKLKEMQGDNGGFTWFKGGADDRYMTQYISTGIGHLRKLNALSGDNFYKLKSLLDKALPYLDKKIKEDYDFLVKQKVKLADNNLSYFAIQYLYMRSFYKDYEIAAASKTAVNYYMGQAKKYWLGQSKYMQAMIALSLYRNADKVTPAAIIRSLKENSINNEELGMYWKEWTNGGYYWYQAPVESQALMIEAFGDIDQKTETIDALKTWLLKQKQTQNWKTTKATAEACYALLLGGSNWLAEEKTVTISLGNTAIKSTDAGAEAGTGYFKKRFDTDQVKPTMGNISVNIQSNVPNATSTSWGSVYWQYFEDLDKITTAATPLQLTKKLFVEKNSDKGPVLVALTDGATLKVGDKIKVRIELKADRDMEYLHLKDMRAACMEPVNVLSQYKWQGGLGYYESTKDASTNFFISWLPRGSYVFEYPVFVTHTGNFSNGISSIQCMYAPEFSSHSEGIRVTVE